MHRVRDMPVHTASVDPGGQQWLLALCGAWYVSTGEMRSSALRSTFFAGQLRACAQYGLCRRHCCQAPWAAMQLCVAERDLCFALSDERKGARSVAARALESMYLNSLCDQGDVMLQSLPG